MNEELMLELIPQLVAEPSNRLMTAKEAAAYLRISLNTLWRMEQRGLLTPYRTLGGHRRYSMAMLHSYLEFTRAHA